MAAEKVAKPANNNVDVLKAERQRLIDLQQKLAKAYVQRLEVNKAIASARKSKDKFLLDKAMAQKQQAQENYDKLSKEVRTQSKLVIDLSQKVQNSLESKSQPMQSKPIVPAQQAPKKQATASQPKFSFAQLLSSIAGAFSKLIANLKLPNIMKQTSPLAMATSKIANKVDTRAASEKSHLGLEPEKTKSDVAVEKAISKAKEDIEKSERAFNVFDSPVIDGAISDKAAESEFQALLEEESDDFGLTAKEAAEIDSWEKSDSNKGDGFDKETQAIIKEAEQEVAEEETNGSKKAQAYDNSFLSKIGESVRNLEKDSTRMLDNASKDMDKQFEELEEKTERFQPRF